MLLALGFEEATRAALRSELNLHGEELPPEPADEEALLRSLASAPVEILVLGPRVPDALRLAERVRFLDRRLAVVIVPPRGEATKTLEAARLGFPLGRDVRVLEEGPALPQRIRQALVEERRRGASRATFASANLLIPSPPPTQARAAVYLDRVMAHAPIGILFVDGTGQLLSMNPAARALLRDAPDASTLRDLFPHDALPDPLPDGEPIVALRPTSDGEQHLEVTATRLEGHGAEEARLVILRDVTERVRQEKELRQARAALAQGEKLAALGSLVAGVAHEVRTPLAYIMNHAELLARVAERIASETGREGQAAEARELARGIQEGVDRINRLVLDLRRFTRQESGQRTPRRLDEVVREAVDLYETAGPRGPRIRRALEPTPQTLLDALRVQQVVINLLQNASEAMGPGGIVRVATRAREDAVELSVTDSGPGIPQDAVDRIFDPLFTTKPEGTGLGLSIVKRIVDAHGGRVEVDTSPRGTTFRVLFPRLQGSAEGGPSPNRSSVSRHSR